MEDIYDHLENYDDLQKIEELKNENTNLKHKIEEYTLAIEKLQKDFDNLAKEHTKLECNYSSLLKTAKAEVERKTNMIQKLNIEKDKLIIAARQNELKKKNFWKGEKYKANKTLDSSSKKSGEVNAKTHTTECTNPNPLPSHGSTSTSSTDARVKNSAYSRNKNYDRRNYKSKEDDMRVVNNIPNMHTEPKMAKITNRRKSMPVLSHDIMYNTDDDCDDGDKTHEKKENYESRECISSLKSSVERNNRNNKMHETSSVENSRSYYKDSVSNYSRNIPNWYNSNDNYKTRDKYESSQRHIWDPVRSFSKGGRDIGNYYQRYYKQSVYENPPPENSYHHARDRRSNYDRDSSRDSGKSRNDIERYAEKHRLQDDPKEPYYKRQKIEYPHRHVEDDMRPQESNASKALLPTPLQTSEEFSCQSPDYIHSDNFQSAAPIREIMNTAVMHLEDPRLSSTKYKIVNDSVKEMLSTVTGRNVAITPVNRKLWDLTAEQFPMPKALLEPPCNYTGLLTMNCTNIDNPTCNVSIDANGVSNQTRDEQHSRSSDYSDASNTFIKDDCITKSFTSEDRDIRHHKIRPKDNQNIVEHDRTSTIKENNGYKVSATSSGTSFRIPKVQDNTNVLANHIEITNISKHSASGNCYKIVPETSKKCTENKSMPQVNISSKSNDCYDDNKSNNKNKEKYIDYDVDRRKAKNDDVKSVTEKSYHESTKIVEADLILSDDASDTSEPQQAESKKETKAKYEENEIKKTSEKQKVEKLPSIKSAGESKTQTCPSIAEYKEKRKITEEKDQMKKVESSTEHNKKHKSKKKGQESKASDVDHCKSNKTKKGKKEKDTKAQEIKTKFSDLFGDSNSLITGDDLGIVTLEAEPSSKSVNTTEDTHDAVDLNIKEMEIGQTSKPKPDVSKNYFIRKQANSQTPSLRIKIECSSIDNIKCDDPEINMKKNEEIYATGQETTEVVNICKDINLEMPNIAKAVTLVTETQQQSLVQDNIEFRQPQTSVDKAVKSFSSSALKALATSTPAKLTSQEQSQMDPVTLQPDSSTSNRIGNSSQTVDQSSDTDKDVPDVRIFVKRRRKLRK